MDKNYFRKYEKAGQAGIKPENVESIYVPSTFFRLIRNSSSEIGGGDPFEAAELADKVLDVVIAAQICNFGLLFVGGKEVAFGFLNPCLDKVVYGAYAEGLFIDPLKIRGTES